MPGLRNSGIDTSAWYLAGYSGTELLVNDPRFIDPEAVFGGNLPAALVPGWSLLLPYQGTSVNYIVARSFPDPPALVVTGAELALEPDLLRLIPLTIDLPGLSSVRLNTYKDSSESTAHVLPPRIIFQYIAPAGRAFVSADLFEIDRANGFGFVTGVGALSTIELSPGVTGIIYYGIPASGPPIVIQEGGNSTITVTLDDASTETIQFAYEWYSPADLPG